MWKDQPHLTVFGFLSSRMVVAYGSCVADNDILYPLEDTITDNFLSRAISYPLKVFRGYKKYPVVVWLLV